MTFPRSADDRPDPADQHAVHARVPEHVSRGVFSTGVIVMTAPTEFVIDFIQNLGRPHQVVARVIMPHPVLPQFVDALLKNIELYRSRYGNLPQPNLSSVMVTHAAGPVAPPSGPAAPGATQPSSPGGHPAPGSHTGDEQAGDLAARLQAGSSSIVGAGLGLGENMTANPAGTDPAAADDRGAPVQGTGQHTTGEQGAGAPGGHPEGGQTGTGQPGGGPRGGSPPSGGVHATGPAHHESPPPVHQRRASAQEIYDDLKIRDEIHSGSYANAVMIGHGPHEFSFDFITNFYPQSAVSARVFLAAGQVARLAESLRGAWDQIRHRLQPPPGGENPPRHEPPRH